MTERNTERRSQAGEGQPGSRTPPAGIINRPDAAMGARTVKRADPTEPEVPSAKRVRAVKRQRSLVVAGSAIAVLVTIVLFLLYKTGRHVTTLGASPSPTVAEAIGPAPEPAATNATDIPLVRPAEVPNAVVPSTVSSMSTASKPAGSGSSVPRAKVPTQATDIFRKPAF